MKPKKFTSLTPERENSTIRLNPKLKKKLLIIKVETGKSLSDLIEEAAIAHYNIDLEKSA
jgi:hypothetical protein